MKATVIIIAPDQVLPEAIKRTKEKDYSVIGVNEWPQGDYLMMPMYDMVPVANSFEHKSVNN